mmetsp:Transcript_48466/g.149742  ORF Transcript_48466/g.149742 Transcript_48466/m.149742 type:complete len:431 (+) Transcript_48466:1395-2687(+)
MDKLRAFLERLPDKRRWLNTPLDAGPPHVPEALFHAVATSRTELVVLLLEHRADVQRVYGGPAMYMGSIKPGFNCIQSVRSRKDRFVGTMLGDRLQLIEGLLTYAEAQQAKGDPPQQQRPKQTRLSVGLEGKRFTVRRSVVLPTASGVMLHTQGHPMQQYDILDHPGQGEEHTSSCRAGRHKETLIQVAIKVKTKEGKKSAEEEVHIWDEITILRRLDHPGIIRLVETFEDDQQVFMILEYCHGGTLLDLMLKEASKMPEAHSTCIVRQAVSSVAYLHSRSICHRDIQPCNFLLVDSGPVNEAVVKLIDFSLAKEYGASLPPMRTKICTPHYVAPEIVRSEDVPYTHKVDMWSLGIVVYVILCGSMPFGGKSDIEVLKKVRKGRLFFRPPAVWEAISSEAKDLVANLICKSPENRYSASDAVRHPWVAKS